MDFIDHLVQTQRLPSRDAARLRRISSERADPWATLIVRMGLVSPDVLADQLADFLGIDPLNPAALQFASGKDGDLHRTEGPNLQV